MLVPIIFRQLIQRLDGIPLRSQIDHKLQKRYFGFLFVQGFIVGVLSSGIVAAISSITQDPGSAPSFLANQLPSSATFFITLVLVTGFAKTSGAILQIAKVVIYYIKVKLLGGNPRSLQKARYTMPTIDFGVSYPNQLLTAVIALSFSVIAPLVTAFACIAFVLWLFTYKYNALFVYDVLPARETGGLFFKTALNQLFAGIYIYCLCLIGLFFLASDQNGDRSAIGEGVVMVVLLVISILVQAYLNWKLNPTSVYLSTSLADETRANERKYAEEMRSTNAGKTGGVVAPTESRATDGTAVAGNGNSKFGNGKVGGGMEDVEAGRGQSMDLGHQDAEMAGGLNEMAFEHPALWRDQPTVWLPRDQLGLSKEAVERGRRRNILITDDDATIDEKAKVEITRDAVPGEDFNPNL
jgi:hypothetical protein